MAVVTIIVICMAMLFVLNYMFRLSVLSSFGSVYPHLPGCSTLGTQFEYWIEHITFGLLYVTFRQSSTKISYKRVPGFATDCTCGVWCGKLTTYLLHICPYFGCQVWNDSGIVSFT